MFKAQNDTIFKKVSCMTDLPQPPCCLCLSTFPRNIRKSPYSGLGDPEIRGSWLQGEGELERKRTKWLGNLEKWSVWRQVGELWNQVEVKFKCIDFRKSKAENSCVGNLVIWKKNIWTMGTVGTINSHEAEILGFCFPTEYGDFPSCWIWKIGITKLRPQEFHTVKLSVNHSSLRLVYRHTFSKH